MRCAIVELMTFLVVTAFKPNKTLPRPSPKLGSDEAWSLLKILLLKFMLLGITSFTVLHSTF
jgi:hypothetical protein